MGGLSKTPHLVMVTYQEPGVKDSGGVVGAGNKVTISDIPCYVDQSGGTFNNPQYGKVIEYKNTTFIYDTEILTNVPDKGAFIIIDGEENKIIRLKPMITHVEIWS